MTKTSLFALALVAAAATVAIAQEPAAPRPAAAAPAGGAMRAPRIAVIDMQTISSNSALGKSYATKLEALENQIKTEGTKKQTELAKRDAAIKTLQDDLEKQASVLSPEAAEKKRADLTRLTRERQAFLEDGQADLQRLRGKAEEDAQKLNAEFQTIIKPIIETVSKEKGVDILLTSQVALTMNPEFDISQAVIAKADATRPAAAAAAAPKPAASPKQ